MITAQWGTSVSLSVLFNFALFSLLAGLTVKREGPENIIYYPVETILLPSEVKRLNPPQKLPPVVEPQQIQNTKPEILPEPPKEDKIVLDKSEEEIPPVEKKHVEQVKEKQEEQVKTEPELNTDTAAPSLPFQPQIEKDYQPYFKVSRLPSFRIQVKPVYPSSERAAGVEARVVVEVFINEYGMVDKVDIVKSGGPLFDQAVIKAVMDSSFNPGYMDDKPLPVKVQIPYLFKLR